MNAPDESIWDALEAAAPKQQFRLQSADELANLPPLSWRIRGILPMSGVVSVYGPTGSGKTFLALDMAAAIAEGRNWFGAKTIAGPVIYCALEGEYGIAQRVQALRSWREETLDGILFLTQPLSLLERDNIAELVKAICTAGADGGLVILDTLNRAAPGADENSSVDMGRIIEAAKRLQSALGGLVMLVHHTGKDVAKGLRGHSSLLASLDAAIEVSRSGDRRAWKVFKAKDGRDGEEQSFRLEAVEIGKDAEGSTVSSCIVIPDNAAEEVRKVKLPQGENQKRVFDALRPLLRDSTNFGKAGAPTCCPCLDLENAVSAGAVVMTCDTSRRTTRAREAISGLIDRDILRCNDGWLWLS